MGDYLFKVNKKVTRILSMNKVSVSLVLTLIFRDFFVRADILIQECKYCNAILKI